LVSAALADRARRCHGEFVTFLGGIPLVEDMKRANAIR